MKRNQTISIHESNTFLRCEYNQDITFLEKMFDYDYEYEQEM